MGVPLPQLKPNPPTQKHTLNPITDLHFKTVRRYQTMEMERDNHQGKPISTGPGPAPRPGSSGPCLCALQAPQPRRGTGRLPTARSCLGPAPGSIHSCRATWSKLLQSPPDPQGPAGWPPVPTSTLSFFLKNLFIYLRESSGGGGLEQREWEKERDSQAASPPSMQPDMEL